MQIFSWTSNKLRRLRHFVKFSKKEYQLKLLQHWKEILFDYSNSFEEKTQSNLFNKKIWENNFGNRLTHEFKKPRKDTIQDVIQLFYNKGTNDHSENKDEAWDLYLNFTGKKLLGKKGKKNKWEEELYYLSHPEFSTRQTKIKKLKITKCQDLVDKH